MNEPPAGEVEEAIANAVRTALTAAAYAAEHALRHRQAEQQRAAKAATQEATALQRRLRAEGAAATASLSAIESPQWWDSATPEAVGEMWQLAAAWRDIEPGADALARRIDEESRRRYGVSPDELQAAASADQQPTAAREAADAQATTVALDLADEALRQEDSVTAPLEPAEGDLDADADYDTPERRAALADALDEAGVPTDAAEARLLADTAQATPALAAVGAAQTDAQPNATAVQRVAARSVPVRPEHGR